MSDLRDVELRGNVPKRLAQLIDALQQARGLPSRMDVVIPVLEAYVNGELHSAMLLCRMAGVNPADSASSGDDPVIPRLGDAGLRSRGSL